MLHLTQPASMILQMDNFTEIVFALLVIGSILLLVGYVIQRRESRG